VVFVFTLFVSTMLMGLPLVFVGLCLLFWRPSFRASENTMLGLGALVGTLVLFTPGSMRLNASIDAEAKATAEHKKQLIAANAQKLFDTMKQQMAAGQWRLAAVTNTRVKVVGTKNT
jgi:hypothetical protein